ncbi:GPR endopeptidase [Lachnospiraceae bacterium 62-35]
MKRKFEIRTDLAVEEKEGRQQRRKGLNGVLFKEWDQEEKGIHMTEVVIRDEKGAKAMGKPVGTYITLEADRLAVKDESYHEEVSEELSFHIRRLLGNVMEEGDWVEREKGEEGKPKTEKGSEAPEVLVVGLGNHYVTPDSLGPRVLGNLQVTRHLERGGRGADFPIISGIVPGVMAQTGMETAEILRGIIKETKPKAIIAIDALAARSVKRLGTTIQLTDTGIHPGSGVGNHRHGLTKDSLGIPVLAIGVPTVVGAAAIVQDTVYAMIKVLEENPGTRGVGRFVDGMGADEQYAFIREILEPEFGSFYVTPPDIDETIKMFSFTISEGIHKALFPA